MARAIDIPASLVASLEVHRRPPFRHVKCALHRSDGPIGYGRLYAHESGRSLPAQH
jgi:hypothetical protein